MATLMTAWIGNHCSPLFSRILQLPITVCLLVNQTISWFGILLITVVSKWCTDVPTAFGAAVLSLCGTPHWGKPKSKQRSFNGNHRTITVTRNAYYALNGSHPIILQYDGTVSMDITSIYTVICEMNVL
jgi:hypothetical protein